MLAHRSDAYIFDDNHFVVLVARQRDYVYVGVFVHARRQFDEHLRGAQRGVLKTGTIRIFANAFKDQTHPASNLFEIDVPAQFFDWLLRCFLF